MIIEVKVPSPGESITEVEIGAWLVENGTVVAKDQEIAEIESDKATLTIVASESGRVEFKAAEGDVIEVGAIACTIDTNVAPEKSAENIKEKDKESIQESSAKKVETEAPVEQTKEKKQTPEEIEPENSKEFSQVKVTPVAKELMKEHGLSVDDVIKGLKRLGKKEIELVLNTPEESAQSAQTETSSREINRTRMSSLRRKLSERLVSVKNEIAMLTTFNEIDMSNLMELRKKNQQMFIEKHGFKLGFMSFFTKAAAVTMEFNPMVNAQIDGEEIISPQYVDVGIAVS